MIEESDNWIDYFYYDYGLWIKIGKDTMTVQVIYLESQEAIDQLKSIGIDDVRTRYFGQNAEEIISAFGSPDRLHADNYGYKYKDGLVNFVCYDFNDFECSEISVQWFP